MVLLAFKYRLKPTSAQIRVLEEQLRLCRWTYNTFLGHCFDEREEGRGTPTSMSLNNCLLAMKERIPELEGVHSQVLQNVAKRVRSGFEGYWNRKKVGLKAHLPRFRGRSKYDSLTYPQFGFSLDRRMLRLSKIGDVKLILHRPLEGKLKTLTVKRSPTGKWYAIFTTEVKNRPITGREKAVGIDFGLNNLVALSDGTLIGAPRIYRNAELKMKRAQRHLSRRARGSRNREKARLWLASIREREANRRRDFAYKTARSIVNRYERIYVEDLKIPNMMKNMRLSKSIGDAGWGMLRNALTYMAERSEGVIAFVEPRGTSQLCSRCGATAPKSLSERTHQCPACGLALDRDVNAARNILKRGLEIGRGSPEYTPVGEAVTTRPVVVEQATSMNQEATQLVGW